MNDWAARARRVLPALLGLGASTLLLAVFARLEPRWLALGWVELVPWLWVLDRSRSAKEAALWSGVLSLSFTAAVFGWFPEALHGYSGAPLVVCWLAVLALAPLMQAPFITFALARHHLRHSVTGRFATARIALTSALVYAGTEWLSPKLFAETLGQGFYASESLRQVADLAGAHGLTLLLFLGNECVLAALQAMRARYAWRRGLLPLGVLGALVLAGTGYGQWRRAQVARATERGPALTVGIVQANLTHYDQLAAERGMYEVVRMILDTHFQLSDALLGGRGVDLLIWPETVYPTTYGSPKSEAGAEFDAELSRFVTGRQVPLLFGTYDLEEGREYNAATFLGATRDGGLTRVTYRKARLFPLTEWVPEAIDSPWLRERLPWTGYWKRGPGPRALPLTLRDGQPLRVAPLICYESIFPGHVAEEARQGAELIVTLSNDSWFQGSHGPRLHLMHAAFRSIETRLPQVRVTNSGISALLSATGEVLAEVPDNQRASLAWSVPPSPHLSTPMRAWGDWFGPTAATLALLLLLGPGLLARFRRR